jgi:hypothetical protein
MYAVDELPFVIGLKAGHRYSHLPGHGGQATVDILQGLETVNFWFAAAEEIKIGTMQNEYFHHCPFRPEPL